jgi:DNA modification methylase
MWAAVAPRCRARLAPPPAECMARPIPNHAGDVYDPFCGSGTTIVAAEPQGRRSFSMEIEPRYVQVAIAR